MHFCKLPLCFCRRLEDQSNLFPICCGRLTALLLLILLLRLLALCLLTVQ